MTYSEIKDIRQPEHEINELLLKRWSPRALNGQTLADEDLLAVLEAAKWAPSAFNSQPWRFIYAKPKTAAWDKLFLPLGDFNKAWVKNAGALILIISKQKFTHNQKDNPTASFDTGAAWQNLALLNRSRYEWL
ncbi:MAG: nitroreductase family protein [Candidatus Falkowbacteria bacterium]|nr:nitroreductase family protein [Candidatus Falkowbacteria bacterium]